MEKPILLTKEEVEDVLAKLGQSAADEAWPPAILPGLWDGALIGRWINCHCDLDILNGCLENDASPDGTRFDEVVKRIKLLVDQLNADEDAADALQEVAAYVEKLTAQTAK
jgi:hypothetical protein